MVDALRGRHRVCHTRSETVAHRAYAKPARTPSPSHRTTGDSDADSARAAKRRPALVCSSVTVNSVRAPRRAADVHHHHAPEVARRRDYSGSGHQLTARSIDRAAEALDARCVVGATPTGSRSARARATCARKMSAAGQNPMNSCAQNFAASISCMRFRLAWCRVRNAVKYAGNAAVSSLAFMTRATVRSNATASLGVRYHHRLSHRSAANTLTRRSRRQARQRSLQSPPTHRAP